MDRQEMPRLHELHEISPPGGPWRSYLDDGLDAPITGRQKLKFLKEIEDDLSILDDASWELLKDDVKGDLNNNKKIRGWQSVLDKLNNAKGYAHLVGLGCTDVEFIPRSKKDRQETPDIKAQLAGAEVLCEVKTINVSNREAAARAALKDGGGGGWRLVDYQPYLDDSFFAGKLRPTLDKAIRQINAYCSNLHTTKKIFVVIHFDDILHQCAGSYMEQIESVKETYPGIDITFFCRPPY